MNTVPNPGVNPQEEDVVHQSVVHCIHNVLQPKNELVVVPEGTKQFS